MTYVINIYHGLDLILSRYAKNLQMGDYVMHCNVDNELLNDFHNLPEPANVSSARSFRKLFFTRVSS